MVFLDSWSRYGSVLEFGLYPSIVAFAVMDNGQEADWDGDLVDLESL